MQRNYYKKYFSFASPVRVVSHYFNTSTISIINACILLLPVTGSERTTINSSAMLARVHAPFPREIKIFSMQLVHKVKLSCYTHRSSILLSVAVNIASVHSLIVPVLSELAY